MPLTDIAIRKLKATDKPYRVTDSAGLTLQVHPNGSKYWHLRFRLAGKERVMSLGSYPQLALKAARVARDEVRQQVAAGIDPVAARRQEKYGGIRGHGFAQVAQEWYAKQAPSWSRRHQQRVKQYIERELAPLATVPVGQLTPVLLLQALNAIEARGTLDTAHRVKQVAGQVMRYAVATGRAERDIAADLKGALAPTPRVEHLPTLLEPAAIGELLRAMEAYHGGAIVCAALQLSPLLLCRPGELRHMEWSEIQWQAQRWEIPAEKMKMRQPHIVPLCRQALEILMTLRSLTGKGRYVLPSPRGQSRPLSENGVRTALRAMGYSNEMITPHGFRAMGRTLLDEVLGYRIEWIEMQLAHAVRDHTGRAYNRTKYLPQRHEMMQAWADYLDRLKANKAVGAG